MSTIPFQRLIRFRHLTLSLICVFVAAPQHLPLHDAWDKVLVGRVALKNGTSPVGLVPVDAVCGGIRYPIGFTDAEGYFRIALASGGSRLNGQMSSDNFSPLNDCDFRARLPSFQSQHVSRHSFAVMTTESTISLGTILLSRPKEELRPPSWRITETNKAVAAYKKGAAGMAQSHWDDARRSFERATEFKPTYYSAWVGLGLSQELLESWQGARLAYEHALGLEPKLAEPYVLIAMLAKTREDWKTVAQYSEAALAIDPKNLPEAYSLCAQANFELNQLDTACACPLG
jgi:tetratricopeptide (TPR) repeat protein